MGSGLGDTDWTGLNSLKSGRMGRPGQAAGPLLQEDQLNKVLLNRGPSPSNLLVSNLQGATRVCGFTATCIEISRDYQLLYTKIQLYIYYSH